MLLRTAKRVGMAAFVLGLFVSASTNFASPLLNETFTYSDGVLAAPTVGNVSGGLWNRTSGSADDLLVSSGRLAVKDLSSDDAARLLSSTVSSGTIFVSFALTEDTDHTTSTLGSEYLGGFNNTGGSYFGTIAPARPTGLGTTEFRVGIANGNGNSNLIHPTVLTKGVAATVVVRFDFSNLRSTLWINPTSDLDTNVIALDDVSASFPTTFNRYGFRQPSTDTMGDWFIDNLKVGTTFADVAVPEPGTIASLGVLGGLLLSRRRD